METRGEREREMGVLFFLEMKYLSSKALIFPGICIEIYTRNHWEMGEYLYIYSNDYWSFVTLIFVVTVEF